MLVCPAASPQPLHSPRSQVADFGLSGRMGDSGTKFTEDNRYLSPETLRDDEYTLASEIYTAFGVVRSP